MARTCPLCYQKISSEEYNNKYFECKSCGTLFNHTPEDDQISFSFSRLTKKSLQPKKTPK